METNVYEAGTGAVRSNDLAEERWDLLSGAACRELYRAMDLDRYRSEPVLLVADSIEFMGRFLGFDRRDVIHGHRIDLLTAGWACLATAIQLLDATPEQIDALRGMVAGPHYPYFAMRRLATTCHEGATKYAEENWHHGFQIKNLANHGKRHQVRWTNGIVTKDKAGRVEDDLGHTMWSFMAMVHVWKFRQHDMCKNLLGEGYTITPELEKYHAEHASRRKANAKTSEELVRDVVDGIAWNLQVARDGRTVGGPAPVQREAHA